MRTRRGWIIVRGGVVVAAMGLTVWGSGRGLSPTQADEGPSAARAAAAIAQATGVAIDELTVARAAPLGDTGLFRCGARETTRMYR
jgi:hypothetical protein